MTTLLDGNVLIALSDRNHVHHHAAESWFEGRNDRAFATCPVTQGTLLRHMLREQVAKDVSDAMGVLQGLHSHPDHHFWPDGLSYTAVNCRGVLGHRQVTDTYLAGLARANQGRLVTFDRGLSILHEDVAELIST